MIYLLDGRAFKFHKQKPCASSEADHVQHFLRDCVVESRGIMELIYERQPFFVLEQAGRLLELVGA
jgi:hypothetical protein